MIVLFPQFLEMIEILGGTSVSKRVMGRELS
jgi:hypothetical protein